MYLTMKHFMCLLENKCFTIRSNKTGVDQYIKRLKQDLITQSFLLTYIKIYVPVTLSDYSIAPQWPRDKYIKRLKQDLITQSFLLTYIKIYVTVTLSDYSIQPQWPRRKWNTDIQQLLIAPSITLPKWENLLNQTKNKTCNPNPQMLNLTALLLLTEISKQKLKDFLNRLETCSMRLGERVHKDTILQNSKSTIAGVVRNKLIPIQLL